MSISRTSSSPELLLPLDRTAPEPLHRQLERGLREAVRTGRLAPDAVVPSSRALADQLGTSRGVVVEAYEQLIAEGYLSSRPGGTTRVARGGARAPRSTIVTVGVPIEIDLRPGRPDLAQFPRSAWSRSVRRALIEAPGERLGYLDGRGVPELRMALAAYLDRVRGTSIDAADVVISSGFTQGLRLLVEALGRRGSAVVAIEDPAHLTSRLVITAAGGRLVPIPVDADGIRVDRLAHIGVDAVLVTPAHQYPTGVVLSPERRAALLAWSERSGALILEDDYDAEYRFDRAPVGALQGLAPDRVVYIGSASKTLAPGLRLGWLAAPRPVAEQLAEAKLLVDSGSPALDQLAFADFLSHGELDRHLRRVRPTYRRRREALLAVLARDLPEVTPVGTSAGLHVLAWLPPTVDEAALVTAARDAGIALEGVAASASPGSPVDRAGRGGLILGYGGADERAIARGVRRLAGLVAAAATG